LRANHRVGRGHARRIGIGRASDINRWRPASIQAADRR
jgi:hypothetical protein